MTKRACFWGSAILSIIVITGGIAWGQAVSQISGTTKDQSGAVIQGVEITVTNTATGIKRGAMSDETGTFVLPNLLIGPYRLEATKAGFRTYVQNGIELQVDSSPSIPITLGLGDVTQTVQVEANATQVETQKLGVGTVMETQRVLDLPLNGRTPTDLIALTPAAVPTGSSVPWSMQTGVTISVAGGVSFGVFYGLDGAPHMNMYDSTNLPLPFPDALQEFKIDTSAQNAQSGTHSGAQVNSVTKSGTNAFHGDALRVLPQWRSERPQLLLGHAGHLEAQPVRRRRRRTDQAEQDFLLRRIPGHHAAQLRGADDGFRAHAEHAAGRFQHFRLGRVPGTQRDTQRAVHNAERSAEPVACFFHQPGRAQDRQLSSESP